MAWESRNDRGRYYTRSRRVDGRVVREYVGKGRAGEIAAGLDAEARALRAAEAEALREYRRRLEPLDRLTAELAAACELLTGATLVAAGFHRHGGEWRRRRDARGTEANRP